MSSSAPPARRSRGRSAAAGLLGLLAVLAILVASVVGTLHAVVLSPDTLTTVLAPVGANPQVQAVVADRSAAKIVTQLDIEGRAQSVIGGRLGALMAPAIARAVQDRIASAIEGALGSAAFEARWEQMVHASASVAIKVLKGDSAAVTTSDGVIYLNVLPAIGSTLDALKTQGIIDASVQLPDLSDPATPAQRAIAMLGSALGISLPPDFGQVAIAQTSALEAAQGAVSTFDAATPILIGLAIALVIAAVALAVDRRAIVVRIGIGAALLVAVVPPLLRFADPAISSGLASPGLSVVASALIDAIVDAVSWPLRIVAAVCLAAALVAMAGAAAKRSTVVLPGLVGVVVFIAVWVAVGPDAALLALGLVTAGAWITGRPRLAQATA